MRPKRLTFLSHFCICLACAGTSFFAWERGVLRLVYENDASMATSAIAVLLIVTAIYLGWQAWLADTGRGSSEFGHLAERLAVMVGFVGTAIGLSLQAKALVSGSASFGALSTSLFTTASGGVAAAIIAVLTFSLETGIRRAGQ